MTATDLRTNPVPVVAASLADEQWRVATLLSATAARGAWTNRLRDEARWHLVRRGHFPANAAELDWTPREVAGHLRDSARVFTERIARLRSEADPRLPDFVPDAPERVAAYRAVPVEELLDDLRTAQAGLLAAVAAVPADELGRGGVHEVDGPVTLGGLLDFLPGHQRDHAEQLAALLAG